MTNSPIRRIVLPQFGCGIRIDLSKDTTIAWLAQRWINGESQKDLARSLGYKNPSGLWSKFNTFKKRFGQSLIENNIPYCHNSYEAQKHIMRYAISRFYESQSGF